MTPKVLWATSYTMSPTMRSYGPEKCVVVTRGSDWGNPFILTMEKDRESVVRKFEQYAHWRLQLEPFWLDPLRGKHLICTESCRNKVCHASILLELANRPVQPPYEGMEDDD